MKLKEIDPAFGKWLAQTREKRGWSQADLARESGVPLGTIREFEQGRREPLFSNMLKLRAALGFDLNKSPMPVMRENNS